MLESDAAFTRRPNFEFRLLVSDFDGGSWYIECRAINGDKKYESAVMHGALKLSELLLCEECFFLLLFLNENADNGNSLVEDSRTSSILISGVESQLS